MRLVRLRTASGVEVWVNPAYVVSVWPTFEDAESLLVMHDGTQTEVKGAPAWVGGQLTGSWVAEHVERS